MGFIKATREVQYTNPSFAININPVLETLQIEFSYTCDKCSGHGSRCSDCCDGRVFEYYSSLSDLERNLGKENVKKLSSILRKIIDD
jgi:hypothetical protein